MGSQFNDAFFVGSNILISDFDLSSRGSGASGNSSSLKDNFCPTYTEVLLSAGLSAEQILSFQNSTGDAGNNAWKNFISQQIDVNVAAGQNNQALSVQLSLSGSSDVLFCFVYRKSVI